MRTFVTFYAYAFEGAPSLSGSPTRGWFAIPNLDHLVTMRARTALGRATGEHLEIYRCHGSIEGDPRTADVDVRCDAAERIYAGDAGEALWWFTMYCARSAISSWTPPPIVRNYLLAGSPALRDDAHRAAWAASGELADTPRLAARIAMYAASDERPLLAAREACRLAGQIAGDRLTAVAALQERALASALLGITASHRARLATEAPLSDASERHVQRIAASLRDSAPTIEEPPNRPSPTILLAMG